MKFTAVIGTRAELINLAPVIRALRSADAEVSTIFTGEHSPDLLKPIQNFFQISPSVKLRVLENTSINSPELCAQILQAMDQEKDKIQADYLLVSGNSASAFAGAYYAFSRKTRIAHVGAGLRWTYRGASEQIRHERLISQLAHHHFAHSFQSARNLMQEGIPRDKLTVTGSTSIDALNFTLQAIEKSPELCAQFLPADWQDFIHGKNFILASLRNPQSVKYLHNICLSLQKIAADLPEIHIILTVGSSITAKNFADDLVGTQKRIHVSCALSYLPFVYLMNQARVILTDSSTIQEEAPSLRVPVILLRETTNHPEVVETGYAKLVGQDGDLLVIEVARALQRGCVGRGDNPFGDGTAADRIVKKLTRLFPLEKKPRPMDTMTT